MRLAEERWTQIDQEPFQSGHTTSQYDTHPYSTSTTQRQSPAITDRLASSADHRAATDWYTKELECILAGTTIAKSLFLHLDLLWQQTPARDSTDIWISESLHDTVQGNCGLIGRFADGLAVQADWDSQMLSMKEMMR